MLDSDRAGEEGSVVSQSEAPGAVTPRSLARVASSPSASASATAACSCSLLLMADFKEQCWKHNALAGSTRFRSALLMFYQGYKILTTVQPSSSVVAC